MKPSSFLLAVALGATAGCTSLPPVNTTLPVVALKAGEAHSSRAQVTINAMPVAFTDIAQHRGLLQKIVWEQVDNALSNQARVGSSMRGPAKVRTAIVPVVPLPAFIVRIVNHSGKPLDFGAAQLQLVDDKGKRFQLYGDLGAVQGRVQDDIIGQYPMMQQQQKQFELMGDVIVKLPMLTKKTKLEDGADWEGYLLFKLDTHTPAELDKYLQSVTKLSIQLSNVGGDTSPTELSVPIEKASAGLAVTCEGGKPQDFAHCTPQPLAE
jgi:hypothetical protein